jgi:predicted nucleic-acid-binding protein
VKKKHGKRPLRKNMKIADANVYLRYLINDNHNLYNKAKNLIENNDISLPNEVLCEIVYVLEKVYKVERHIISETLIDLVGQPNINVIESNVAIYALKLYMGRMIDFVDCLLAAYATVNQYEILSFDNKLNKLISSIQ